MELDERVRIFSTVCDARAHAFLGASSTVAPSLYSSKVTVSVSRQFGEEDQAGVRTLCERLR